MKRLLILFFALFSALGTKAQDYKPMSQFGTDSIAYMRYNFETRKSVYINQPVSKFLNDYELELAVSHPTTTYPYAPGANGQEWIDGMVIKYDWSNRRRPYGVLFIDFKAPLLPWKSTLNSMGDSDDDAEWAKKLKNQIVSDIRLAIGPFTPEPKPETRAPERERKVVKPVLIYDEPFVITL